MEKRTDNTFPSFDDLAAKAQWVRNQVLNMATFANSGHVSTAFSQTEVLVALYYGKLLNYNSKEPKWDGRDRFILSKGQGGIGLYPILADVGYFPKTELDSFAGRGNILGVHAEWNIPGIEIITGSLGHGLPMAVGMAQAAKNDGKNHLVFCMLGDAELYEGSNWEAAIMASHLELDNLICIIDRNGQGVMGFTDKINGPNDGPRLNPLDEKFKAFGFDTYVINGHDFSEIFNTFSKVRNRTVKKPMMVIANTEKGHGSDLIANQRMWHYRVPKGEELNQVRDQILAQMACTGKDSGQGTFTLGKKE